MHSILSQHFLLIRHEKNILFFHNIEIEFECFSLPVPALRFSDSPLLHPYLSFLYPQPEEISCPVPSWLWSSQRAANTSHLRHPATGQPSICHTEQRVDGGSGDGDGGADKNEDETFHSRRACCHVATILPDWPQGFRLNTQTHSKANKSDGNIYWQEVKVLFADQRGRVCFQAAHVSAAGTTPGSCTKWIITE